MKTSICLVCRIIGKVAHSTAKPHTTGLGPSRHFPLPIKTPLHRVLKIGPAI